MFPTVATAATSEISPGLLPWRRGACVTSLPKHGHGGVDPAQSILNSGFLLPCLERTEIHLEEHKNGAQLSLLCLRPSFSVTALKALRLDWL